MSYIYKITNLINNKIYIGQTVNKIEYRLQEHFHAAITYKDKSVLHSAMRKYGKEAFIIEVIEECENNKLSDREKYWIAFYDSTNRNIGYNITIGGEGTRTVNREKVMDLWEQGFNQIQIANQLNICRQSVKVALDAYGILDTDKHKRDKKNNTNKITLT